MSGSSINIVVNGKAQQVQQHTSVADVLTQLDINPKNASGIAVAVNDEVVPKNKWEELTLSADDTVEVITATQGG